MLSGEKPMKKSIAVFKALSDPHRLRAFMALQGGELCICQIIALLELAPSTVSKHMSILKQAGLVESRKEGRWIYYCRASMPVPVETLLSAMLDDDGTVENDRTALGNILSSNRSDLCSQRKAHKNTSESSTGAHL